MPWYQIINAKSDSYIADRDAEDLLRQVATALQAADGPVEVMAVLKRLDDLIERVNGEATGLTSRRPESQPSHTWGS